MLKYSYGKYELGNYGYEAGAVLRQEEHGTIQAVVRMKGGEWAVYIKKGGDTKWTFPIWNHFPNDGKTSLGELTRKEFDETMRKLGFLPRGSKKELYQCYRVLRSVYDAHRDGSLQQ